MVSHLPLLQPRKTFLVHTSKRIDATMKQTKIVLKENNKNKDYLQVHLDHQAGQFVHLVLEHPRYKTSKKNVLKHVCKHIFYFKI